MVDGPSLGGFVCPATVPLADRWKIGQLKPGDKIRFTKVTLADVRCSIVIMVAMYCSLRLRIKRSFRSLSNDSIGDEESPYSEQHNR